MVIEKRFREQYEQQKAAEAKKTAEIEPKPLVEILKDQQQSELLAAYLYREEKTDLAEKLLRKKIKDFTEQDLEVLEAARQEVKRSYETAKSIVEKRLTPDRITLIAQSSEEFRKIVNVLGADKTKAFLEQHLARIAISDKQKLDSIVAQLGKIKTAEASLRETWQKAEEIRRRYGFREDEFVNALMSKDPGKAVGKLVQEHSSLLEKIKFKLPGFKVRGFEIKGKKGLDEMVNKIVADVNPENIRQRYEEIDELLAGVGGAIGGVTLENKELRKLLVAELYKQAGYKVETDGRTFNFVEAAKELPLPGKEDIRGSFENFLKEQNQNWNDLDNQAKQTAINTFIDNYLKTKKVGEKVGVFNIFYRLFKTIIEQMMNSMYNFNQQ